MGAFGNGVGGRGVSGGVILWLSSLRSLLLEYKYPVVFVCPLSSPGLGWVGSDSWILFFLAQWEMEME